MLNSLHQAEQAIAGKAPYSAVEHIAGICCLHNWKDVRFVVFTVAFDASGSKGDPVISVAGFVSGAADWKTFETAWNSRLADDGLEYLHMQEFVSLQGQFSGWDQGIRRERGGKLMEDLVGIIKANTYRKFGCIMFVDFLEKHDPANRERFMMDKAYAIAGRHVSHDVAAWARMERLPRLPELVFECGDFGKGDLIDGLAQDGWPMPIFRPKREMLNHEGSILSGFVPLQAADMLAHTYFTAAREMKASPDFTFGEKWRYAQFESMAGTIGYYSHGNVEEMNRMATVLREQEDWAKSKGLRWN